MSFTLEQAITRVSTMLDDPDLQRYVTNSSTLVGLAREAILSSLSINMTAQNTGIDDIWGLITDKLVSIDYNQRIDLVSECPDMAKFLKLYPKQTSTGAIAAANITSGNSGSGFAANDLVKITGSGAGNAILIVNTVSLGAVTGFTILNCGGGYSITTGVTTTKVTGTGTGLKIDITRINGALNKNLRMIDDPYVFNGYLGTNFVNTSEVYAHKNGNIINFTPNVYVAGDSYQLCVEYIKNIDQSITKSFDLQTYFSQQYIDRALIEAVKLIQALRNS